MALDGALWGLNNKDGRGIRVLPCVCQGDTPDEMNGLLVIEMGDISTAFDNRADERTHRHAGVADARGCGSRYKMSKYGNPRGATAGGGN